MKKIEEIINTLLAGKISAASWLAIFLGIVTLRLFLDKFVAQSAFSTIQPEMDLHNYLFFGLVFLFIWLFLSLILKTKPQNLAFLMIWACLLIALPPIFDLIKTGGAVYVGPYLYGNPGELKMEYLTIFGQLPSGMVYFGTKIVFILVSLGSGGLVWVKTKNWIKTLFGLIGSYSLLFFMASFPSWLAFIYYFLEGSKKITELSAVHIFQFISQSNIFSLKAVDFEFGHIFHLNLIYFPLIAGFSGLLFFFSDRDKFWAVLKNIRIPQCFFHGGLFLVGLGLGYLAYPDNLTFNLFSLFAILGLIIAILLAWKTSVIVNDLYDFKIDKVTNSSRPLPQSLFSFREYAELGIICFLFSLIGGLAVNFKFAVLLLVYQIIAWFYSAPPFRFKRFPLVATFLSSLALLVILFMGFLVFSGENNLQGLSWRIIFLFLLVLTLSLPIKDFKDMESDRQAGVWTIPVIFGEELGRIIVGSGIFLSFVSSVFFLNERDLFFWAVILGAIAFLIVVSEKIKTRQLIWWILPCVFIYGLIVVNVALLG
jgi:4-hydroxybenzoate polyprenyltransferase